MLVGRRADVHHGQRRIPSYTLLEHTTSTRTAAQHATGKAFFFPFFLPEISKCDELLREIRRPNQHRETLDQVTPRAPPKVQSPHLSIRQLVDGGIQYLSEFQPFACVPSLLRHPRETTSRMRREAAGECVARKHPASRGTDPWSTPESTGRELRAALRVGSARGAVLWGMFR